MKDLYPPLLHPSMHPHPARRGTHSNSDKGFFPKSQSHKFRTKPETYGCSECREVLRGGGGGRVPKG